MTLEWTEQEQEDTTHTNEEWDFDDPASPRLPSPPSDSQIVDLETSTDSFRKPRGVSFGEEFGRENITRKDTVASATSVTDDSIRSEPRISFTDKPTFQEPAGPNVPKKSRFVVDNPNVTIQSQRTDSSNSAVEIIQPVASPSLPAEVKKGRFSVIDNPNQPQPPVSATSASSLANSQGNLSVPTVQGATATSPLISPAQSLAEPLTDATSTNIY